MFEHLGENKYAHAGYLTVLTCRASPLGVTMSQLVMACAAGRVQEREAGERNSTSRGMWTI